MTLTATFDSYKDMMDFAKALVGQENKPALKEAIRSRTPQPEPVAPVTPIAAPVAQTAPTQQVPTTPSAPLVQQAPATPAAQPVPTTAPSYTLDDLTKAAIPLMDSGKQPELLQLIRSFGVEALPSLQPDQYGAFATALRGLGAQI